MKPDPSATVTGLLARLRGGDQAALGDLIPIVHDELRAIARRQLRPSLRGDTLETTALVNEAYVRLSGKQRPSWNDRCHFLSVAAIAMRHVLVDQVRRRLAQKRAGAQGALPLDEAEAIGHRQDETLLAVHQGLESLAADSPDLARVVECRYFGGMTFEETAEALGRNERTIRRRWQRARAWLHRELAGSGGDDVGE